VVALAAALAVPHVASAAILVGQPATSTYTPNPADMGDLDHHYVYTWRIPSVNLAGGVLSGATITFQNLYNWDSSPNDLFMHLLDTARIYPAGTNSTINTGTYGSTGSVNWFMDESSSTVTTLRDDFTANFDPDGAGSTPAYHNNPNWLVPAGTSDTTLDAQSFPGLGGNPTGLANPGPDKTGFVQLPGAGSALTAGTWYYNQQGTLNGSLLYDYTYVFSATALSALSSYIGSSGGGDVALGFDPDCHYFNDGIALNIFTTQPTQNAAVPEPATLFLLGSGLVVASRRYRKNGVKQ
jgi:hypothetical protein